MEGSFASVEWNKASSLRKHTYHLQLAIWKICKNKDLQQSRHFVKVLRDEANRMGWGHDAICLRVCDPCLPLYIADEVCHSIQAPMRAIELLIVTQVVDNEYSSTHRR